MVRNEKSIMIDRPIKAVFAFLGDLENQTQWDPELLEVRRTTDGPRGLGTRYTSVRKVMGREMQADIEFVAYEPNTKLTYRSTSGSLPWVTSQSLESTD